MKLTTQDGRTIELDRNEDIVFDGRNKWGNKPARVQVRAYEEFTIPGKTYIGHHVVKDYGFVATYSTDTCMQKAVAALREAWKSGATEFTMPADTCEKTAWEAWDDFCRENHLTACAINEVGYSRDDEIRNRHIWETTDYFERQGIIICDDYGSYERSLAKWRAIA